MEYVKARLHTCLIDWIGWHCCVHRSWGRRWCRCRCHRVVILRRCVIDLWVLCSLVHRRGIDRQRIDSSTRCLGHCCHRCVVCFCWIIHLGCLNNWSREVVGGNTRSTTLQQTDTPMQAGPLQILAHRKLG